MIKQLRQSNSLEYHYYLVKKVKRGENPLFDVTMGGFDGAEICKIVGIHLLEKLSHY